MSGSEVAVRGREMALKNPVGGRPIVVDVEAEALEVTFETVPGLDRPTIKLYAAEDIIDRTTRKFDGTTWTVRLPRDGRGYGSGGGFQVGNNNTQVNYYGGGRRTIVDGVDVTDFARGQRGAAAAQVPRAVITVPSLSVLVASIDAGDITTSGTMSEIRATTMGGSIRLGDGVREAELSSNSGDIIAGSVGRITAGTIGGDIRVGGGNGEVSAKSVSGDITVFMLAAAVVLAKSMSGDVIVDSVPGVSLAGLVLASSMSGRVRAPR